MTSFKQGKIYSYTYADGEKRRFRVVEIEDITVTRVYDNTSKPIEGPERTIQKVYAERLTKEIINFYFLEGFPMYENAKAA